MTISCLPIEFQNAFKTSWNTSNCEYWKARNCYVKKKEHLEAKFFFVGFFFELHLFETFKQYSDYESLIAKT